MTLEEIVQAIQARVQQAGDLRGIVKFVIDGTKVVHVDATQRPVQITTEDKPADCTIRLSGDTFQDLISGKGSAMTAFMFGKIKVEGNMGIAMAISRIL
ncbi:MAG: SCP2 sterol-binding domain-containing protein [Bacteroidia bacterium]|jgi:putative sterol carrier protein|nr:SCP2 sterol-binding domain-containing protein [Bacteroidia bacterium]GIV23529.1 MAG: sterol-binding protein [Bacteroidia bacterium]